MHFIFSLTHHKDTETTVTIQGNNITLQEGAQTYKGKHTQSSVPGPQEFELSEGLFAGGQFLVFTDGSAELTVFGSGVPVIAKHRGPLTKV